MAQKAYEQRFADFLLQIEANRERKQKFNLLKAQARRALQAGNPRRPERKMHHLRDNNSDLQAILARKLPMKAIDEENESALSMTCDRDALRTEVS